MKNCICALILGALVIGGCAPKKSKVCEGCLGSNLQACEEAYEACGTVEHCRYADIKQKWSEGHCIEE